MNTAIIPAALLTPGANISAYIQAVNGISVLSVEEERELGEALFYREDLEAARRLVLAHLRFVVYPVTPGLTVVSGLDDVFGRPLLPGR